MEIQPLGERVLLKVKKQEEKTAGGIYIPSEAREEKKEGKVIAVGTFKDGKSLPLQPGDIVLYGGYSSEEFELNKEKHLLIDFKDILGKIIGGVQ
jgi:chaperonin GroES